MFLNLFAIETNDIRNLAPQYVSS